MATLCAIPEVIGPARIAKGGIVVLFHRLGPYHFARLRAAGAVLPIVGIETSGVDETYAWDFVAGADQFERITLCPDADAQTLPARKVAAHVTAALDRVRPSAVVIPGWSDCAALAALQWSINHRVQAIVMSETTAWDDRRVWWKDWIKRRLVSLCCTGLAGGSPHADYLARLGLRRDRIFLGYDAVDNDYFADQAAAIQSRALVARAQLRLPRNYFLASARFVEKKNLPRLIQAYARYRELVSTSERGTRSTEMWSLLLLGDGSMRPAIEAQIARLNLRGHVDLPGFKQYADLPAFYALAGAFVHASAVEQWGLVVNEAMASGLPVMVSNRCGCAADLVKENRNGFTFDPYNIEELAQLFLKVSAPDFPRIEFGAASREIIANWGPDRFAQGLKNAVEVAANHPARNAGPLDHLVLRLLLSR